MEYAIETSGLKKSFGKTHALAGVDLKIRKGSVYGLLGPNGAGKTTIIRILATLLAPTGGSATVLGMDVASSPKEVRKLVSLTGQYASVDDELTGIENMVLIGRLLGLKWSHARQRGNELLLAFGLEEAAKKQVKTYSGGMRRRLDIAASIVITPEILFLDEPTTGLDPRSRNQVWEIVRKIAKQGTTVVLTTQYLEEADRLADRMAVIDHGRVIAEGTSAQLKASIGASSISVKFESKEHLETARSVLKKFNPNQAIGEDEGSLTIPVSDQKQASKILDLLHKNELTVEQFSLGSPSLDDVFFAITGRPAEVTA